MSDQALEALKEAIDKALMWTSAGADPTVVTTILANLPEGFALVSVDDVARRLHERIVRDRGYVADWDRLDDAMKDRWLVEGRLVLGIGGER